MAVSLTPPGPTQDVRPVRRALISVFDKTGLEDLVRGLHDAGVTLVSTGGSAALIDGLGVPVTRVEELTGFPECLEGRVKTLHPMVHAGLLADTRKPEHLAQLADLGVAAFDLVVVNLYPFTQTVASGAGADQIVENIDIGGPSMIRAAAKNHPSVAVVTDPTTYPQVLVADHGVDGVPGLHEQPAGDRPHLHTTRGRRVHPRSAQAAGRRGVHPHRDLRHPRRVLDGQCVCRHLGRFGVPGLDGGNLGQGGRAPLWREPAPASRPLSQRIPADSWPGAGRGAAR